MSPRPGALSEEELSITVTVRPKIMGKNGYPMASPVKFSRHTNTEIVTDKYTAGNIWAIHKPDTAAGEADFFYDKAVSVAGDHDRDARLRKNGAGNYQVSLYFSVSANREEMSDPDHCMVQEYRAYDLAGSNKANMGKAASYEITPITSVTSDNAANIYRSNNSNIKTYRIIHEMDPNDHAAGIWRLVLTPYLREGDNNAGLDSWTNAHSAGSYAVVVLNSTLPTGNAILSLNIFSMQLFFRDSLEQVNDTGLETNARLTYYESLYGDVSAYSAVYDPDADTITVSWTNPAAGYFDHVEAWYRENDIEIKRNDLAPRAAGFTIRNVPRLDVSGVVDGKEVKNIYCYEIFMKTHGEVDSRPALSFKIWNFGTPGETGSGMRTGIAAGFTEAIEVIDADSLYSTANKTIGLSKIASHNLGGQYVLADNITISSEWMPIGANVNSFQGKFFGNGNIISFNSIFADVPYTGIFGYISSAEIRDLCIIFSIPVSENYSEYTGGIAGFAEGTAKISNCIVKGGTGGILSVSNISSRKKYLGAIVGYMQSGVIIKNSFTDLDVELIDNSNEDVFAGGVIGYIEGLIPLSLQPDIYLWAVL